MSSSRDLKLLCEIAHEPIRVGTHGEVHVTVIGHIDDGGFGLHLRNVGVCSLVRADLVILSYEEGHWHLLDVGHLNQRSLVDTIEPLGIRLLKTISETVCDPVLLRGN